MALQPIQTEEEKQICLFIHVRFHINLIPGKALGA